MCMRAEAAAEAGRAIADGIRGAVTPQIALATMQAASAADVTELLPSVAVRTLVLHPRDMTRIPIEVARSLAAGLPRGRLIVLEGAQPVLFTEDAGEVVGGDLADWVVPERWQEITAQQLFGDFGAVGDIDDHRAPALGGIAG